MLRLADMQISFGMLTFGCSCLSVYEFQFQLTVCNPSEFAHSVCAGRFGPCLLFCGFHVLLADLFKLYLTRQCSFSHKNCCSHMLCQLFVGATRHIWASSLTSSLLCVYCNRGLLSSHTPREFHQLYCCSSQNKYTRSNAIWYQFHPGFISIHRYTSDSWQNPSAHPDETLAPPQKKDRSRASDTVCQCVVPVVMSCYHSQFGLCASLSPHTGNTILRQPASQAERLAQRSAVPSMQQGQQCFGSRAIFQGSSSL